MFKQVVSTLILEQPNCVFTDFESMKVLVRGIVTRGKCRNCHFQILCIHVSIDVKVAES